jgi:hypothetical protein
VNDKVTNAITECIRSIGFEVRRIVCAENLYKAAREACVCQVNLGDHAIQLRVHPALPDDLMLVFGAEGSFEVIRLEEA